MNVLNYISSTATEVISKSIVAPLRVVSNKVTEYRTKEEKDEKPDRIYETNKYEQYKSLTYEPINIIDNLYLGHAINAGSYYVLKKLNIGLIMNVTNEIDNYFEDCKEFEYAKYDISDNGKDKINNHLINSYLKIIDYQKTYPDKNIFIHCYMGASRSVSVILYYLMKQHDKTLDEAIEFVKNKKNCINISTRFRDDIIETYACTSTL